MFDSTLRSLVSPLVDRLAERMVEKNISANATTLAGFFLAVLSFAAISVNWLWPAAALILLSRLCDGLDGEIAKRTKPTDFGGFLDIVLDFAFYGLIPIGFAVLDPTQNALAVCVLLFSFYVNGASFLAFSILAEKRNMRTDIRGKKSFFFTTGLAEAGETLAVFLAFCLFPSWFSEIAFVFAAICLWTAFARVLQAKAIFKD